MKRKQREERCGLAASCLPTMHDGRRCATEWRAMWEFFPNLLVRGEDVNEAGTGSFSTVYEHQNVAWKVIKIEGRAESFLNIARDEEAALSLKFGRCRDPLEDAKCAIKELIVLKEASEKGIAPKVHGAILMRTQDKTPDEPDLTEDRVRQLNDERIVQRPMSYFEARRFHFDLVIVMEKMDMTLHDMFYYRIVPEEKRCFIESELRRLLGILHDEMGITCTDMVSKNVMIDLAFMREKKAPFKGQIRLIDFGGGFCRRSSPDSLLLSMFALSLDVYKMASAGGREPHMIFRKECKEGADKLFSVMASQETTERYHGTWPYMLNHYFRKIDNETFSLWRRHLFHE